MSEPLVVRFNERAQAQLLAAAMWWRERRPAARQLLDDEVASTLRQIALFPRSYPMVFGRNARRAFLAHTSYFLYYRIRPRRGVIEVMMFVHARRKP